MRVRVAALLLVALFSPSFVRAQNEATASAQSILERTATVYRTCRSYRDTGAVTIVFIEPRGKSQTVVRPFRTEFVRPRRFRFEYTEKQGGTVERYVVWDDGHVARSWWTVDPQVRTSPSLRMPLAGATGVSGGSAHTAPRLLMPETVGGWAITDLANARVLGADRVGGADCWKLTGLDRQGNPNYVWIDKRTYLLRKEFYRWDNPRTETTTIYQPQIDVAIPDSVFTFTPPVTAHSRGAEAAGAGRGR